MARAEPEATASKYPYFEDVNEGVIRQIPSLASDISPPRVLDLGCGSGMLGAAIREKGYEVWGIERDPTALAKAERRLDRVIDGDVANAAASLLHVGATFDVLVFSDVLEHLVDPVGVLHSYLPLLRAGGKVVVSVPNVANWQTRVGLAFGRFNYQDVGVLDRTHLRFFTKGTVRILVENAGFDVESIDFTPLIARAIAPLVKRIIVRRSRSDDPSNEIVDSPLFNTYMRVLYPLEYALCRLLPGLLSFRLIVVGRPHPDIRPGQTRAPATEASSPTGALVSRRVDYR